MQTFTAARTPDTHDEIWLLQHPPVYTLGLKLKDQVLHQANGIPVVHCDRGGDVTYHGPGQLVVYILIDLQRRSLGVKGLVHTLEQVVIDLLEISGVRAERRAGAPGVYVTGKKIAALGLRVRQGCSYHGLALNVNMDLKPFAAIAPCGFPGLQVTQLADLDIRMGLEQVQKTLLEQLLHHLGYTARPATSGAADFSPASVHG